MTRALVAAALAAVTALAALWAALTTELGEDQ